MHLQLMLYFARRSKIKMHCIFHTVAGTVYNGRRYKNNFAELKGSDKLPNTFLIA